MQERHGETARAALEGLLVSLFDADQLHRYIANGPEGATVESEVPTMGTTRERVFITVSVLSRRGLIDIAFFDRLRSEFPQRDRDVRAVCAHWIRERPVGTACPPIAALDSGVGILADRLEQAFQLREDLIIRGSDSAQIDAEIRELQREIRRGPQLRPGETLLAGRYRLVEALGHGGFATVWKAYDRETRDLVALKVLHGQWTDDRSRRERFVRGARGMMRLHHPAIVRVLREPIEDEGFWFCVLEHINGPSLHRSVLDGKMSWEDALKAVHRVCGALIHAHAHGIVHRDVKPANILLDSTGCSYLSDFDLLLTDNSTGGTGTGTGLGTLFYAAPEALADASCVDARADVYSVGMTLLFCWLGRELRVHELFGLKIERLDVPPVVRAVLERATATEVEDRYPSMQALSDAIEQLSRSSSVESKQRGALVFARRLDSYAQGLAKNHRCKFAHRAGTASWLRARRRMRLFEDIARRVSRGNGRASYRGVLPLGAKCARRHAFSAISLQMKRRTARLRLRSLLATKRQMKAILARDEHKHNNVVLLRDSNDTSYPKQTGNEQTGRHPSWVLCEVLSADEDPMGLTVLRHQYLARVSPDRKCWDAIFEQDFAQFHAGNAISVTGGLEIDGRSAFLHEFWREYVADEDRAHLNIAGIIPFERILAIDPDGDRQYPVPHIFVEFGAENGPFRAGNYRRLDVCREIEPFFDAPAASEDTRNVFFPDPVPRAIFPPPEQFRFSITGAVAPLNTATEEGLREMLAEAASRQHVLSGTVEEDNGYDISTPIQQFCTWRDQVVLPVFRAFVEMLQKEGHQARIVIRRAGLDAGNSGNAFESVELRMRISSTRILGEYSHASIVIRSSTTDGRVEVKQTPRPQVSSRITQIDTFTDARVQAEVLALLKRAMTE